MPGKQQTYQQRTVRWSSGQQISTAIMRRLIQEDSQRAELLREWAECKQIVFFTCRKKDALHLNTVMQAPCTL
eukprot:1145821-Pelagomonas_calceolata.AAC.1